MSSICMQSIGVIRLIVSERNIFKICMKMCLLYDICDVLIFATYAFVVFFLVSIAVHLQSSSLSRLPWPLVQLQSYDWLNWSPVITH